MQDTGHQGRSKRWLVAVIGTSFALGLLLAVLFGGTSESRNTQQIEGDGQRSAPRGDFVTLLRPGRGQGPNIDRRLELLIGPPSPEVAQLVPGSAEHAATAQTQAGVVEIYTWRAVQRGIPTRCSGELVRDGSSSGCRGVKSESGFDNELRVGGFGAGNGNGTWQVTIDGIEPGAAWLVVETRNGTRVVANVINRVSYAEWPAQNGFPDQAFLLDGDGDELWGATRFQAGS